VLLAVAASPGLVSAGLASAATLRPPAWAIQSTPNPPNSVDDALPGVSCPGPSQCIAVGLYLNTSGPVDTDQTLAEEWNAASTTGWIIQQTPNVSSTTPTGLNGVSCPTTTRCFAVGSYSTPNLVDHTFAAVWSSGTWTEQTIPDPSGGGYLVSVSCTSPTACTAAGGYFASAKPLAERWNGSKWTIQSVPKPPSGGEFSAVSCASATYCVGGGGTQNFAGFADVWDGSTWTEHDPPPPAQGPAWGVSSVSCVSASNCTAAGGVLTQSQEDQALAYGWNGTAWTEEPTPDPGANASLAAVSCATATSCQAIGTWIEQGVGAQTLAEGWNGSKWSIEATPQPDGDSYPEVISCSTATVCTATGELFPGSSGATVTLAYRYS
jgi:hypothetical protein